MFWHFINNELFKLNAYVCDLKILTPHNVKSHWVLYKFYFFDARKNEIYSIWKHCYGWKVPTFKYWLEERGVLLEHCISNLYLVIMERDLTTLTTLSWKIFLSIINQFCSLLSLKSGLILMQPSFFLDTYQLTQLCDCDDDNWALCCHRKLSAHIQTDLLKMSEYVTSFLCCLNVKRLTDWLMTFWRSAHKSSRSVVLEKFV